MPTRIAINPRTQLPFRRGEEVDGKLFWAVGPRGNLEFVTPEVLEKRKLKTTKLRTKNAVALHLFHDARRRAKMRGAVVTISKRWILDQIEHGCALTKLPFQIGTDGTGRRSGYAPSLDRIDPDNYNYTLDNTRVVLDFVNNALGRFPKHETREVLRAYLTYLQEKEERSRSATSIFIAAATPFGDT